MNEKPHYLGHRKRIREKFSKSKLEGLHPYELLELLLTYVIPRKDTKPIAKNLLNKFKTIQNVLNAQEEQLIEVEGIGEKTALFLSLIRELIKMYFQEKLEKTFHIKSPAEVLQYCKASLGGRKEEYFEVIYLSSKNSVIETETLFHGTIDRTAVYPRKIFRNALKNAASAIILVHNHPSGEPSPSEEDKTLTGELLQVSDFMGIRVLDHIIIGSGNRYFSFKEHGLTK